MVHDSYFDFLKYILFPIA